MGKIIHATILLILAVLFGYGVAFYFPASDWPIIGGALCAIAAGVVSCAAIGEAIAEVQYGIESGTEDIEAA